MIRQKNFEVLAGIDEVEPPTFAVQEQKQLQPIVPKHDELPNDGNVSELKEEIVSLKEMLKSMKQDTIQASIPEELKPFIEYLKRQELNNELITDICDGLFAHVNQSKEISRQEMVEIAKNVLKKELSPFQSAEYLMTRSMYVCWDRQGGENDDDCKNGGTLCIGEKEKGRLYYDGYLSDRRNRTIKNLREFAASAG